MIKDKTKRYLTISLEATPVVLTALLKSAALEDFDKVVDPERFTLRVMLAHLADWETIHLNRLHQFKDEASPVIQGIDEGEWAIEHNHDKVDPAESLQNFIDRRKKIVSFVEGLDNADWVKTGYHTEAGDISLAEYLILISVHDGYHLKQTVEWLNL